MDPTVVKMKRAIKGFNDGRKRTFVNHKFLYETVSP